MSSSNKQAVLWLTKHKLCAQVAARFKHIQDLLPPDVSWSVRKATKERFTPSLCLYSGQKLVYRIVGANMTPQDLLVVLSKL